MKYEEEEEIYNVQWKLIHNNPNTPKDYKD